MISYYTAKEVKRVKRNDLERYLKIKIWIQSIKPLNLVHSYSISTYLNLGLKSLNQNIKKINNIYSKPLKISNKKEK